MARYRIYIEETSVRLLYTDVEAADKADADAQAAAALESGAWANWGGESSSECSLEAREELTEFRAEWQTSKTSKAGR